MMSSLETENLSVKIVTADYYLHNPIPELGDQCYSAFRSSPIYRVPVIRIFGPNSEGVKTCLHVHGVFPYIFVPNWNDEITEKELYNFAASLDKAINTSFAHSNSKSSHVHKIIRVSGTPFYGYHESEKNFLKIEFYNPSMIKRASDLLLNGSVLNTIFQPHEAHIPYILQFFIDNNLYGMNDITFSGYKVRRNDTQEIDLVMNESIIGSSSGVSKQSHSKLEIDITVSNLCSGLSNEENLPNNPGLAFIWEDEKKRRRFNQKSSQITPNESQQRPEKPVTRTEQYFREKLVQKLQAIKDNQVCMDLEYDEMPSSGSVYGELNTQSKSLLEILQDLADQQEKNKETTRSGSSSPSLVYSDDEHNATEVSLICSQPLLKFNAEDDSILGNNFSDDENDIDDHDHKALSQSINYPRQQSSLSSDDSDTEMVRRIPQLDGACDTKNVKKSATKKVKSSKQKPCRKITYNLRSKGKNVDKSDQDENFQPRDFKIILRKLEHPAKTTPRKSYPRLSIDTQKSPRSNQSKWSQDLVNIYSKEPILLVPRVINNSTNELLPSLPRTKDENAPPFEKSPSKEIFKLTGNNTIVSKSKEPILLLPRLTDELSEEFLPSLSRTSSENAASSASSTKSPSTKTSRSADNSSLLGSDKKMYPQLNITIKKSPKSSQKPTLEEANRPAQVVTNFQSLKKRKINFGDDETDSSISKKTMDADLLSPRWKKSLKRRKKDDTSFKIGDSFSLLEFQKIKKARDAEKGHEKLTNLDGLTNISEMDSQNYSLRINAPACSNISFNTLEKPNQVNHSSEMESLQISDDEEDTNKKIKKSNIEENYKSETSQISKLPLMESDDESLLAVPLERVENNEIEPNVDSLADQSSNSSAFRVPILRVPRICSDMINNSASLSLYENSSIELNVSESNENRAAFQLKLNENSNLTTSKFEETRTEDLGNKLIDSTTTKSVESGINLNENDEMPISKVIEKIVHSSKTELIDVVKSHEVFEKCERETKLLPDNTQIYLSEPNLVKVPKKPGLKKKNLGMRMRNSIKQPKSNSKLNQNTSKTSSKIKDDERSVEKLPMTLVNDENGQNKELNTPELYPDSNIELEIMKSTSDSSPKNSNIKLNTSKNDENACLTTSHQNKRNSANSNHASCSKIKTKGSTKLTSPPCFEDSQIELDITKFCSKSFEDSTKESQNASMSVQNRNLATSLCDMNVETNKALMSTSTANDSYGGCRKEASLMQNLNEKEIPALSQSIFSDEILVGPNASMSDAAADDDNPICSQETLFEENPLMNENLPSSQFTFCDKSFIGASNTKLPESALDDIDLFFSQGTSSQQNLMNENLILSQSILGDDILDRSSNSMQEQLMDDNDTFFSQDYLSKLNDNVDENFPISLSCFHDDDIPNESADKLRNSSIKPEPSSNLFQSTIPNESKSLATSQNLTNNANDNNDDLNISCSNDSLLNVLNSLTPRSKDALNRKLDSFEEENSATVLSQEPAAFKHVDSEITNVQNQLCDGAESFTTFSHNSKNQVQTDPEQSSSQDSRSSDILNKSTYKLNLCSSNKSTKRAAHEEILFEEDSFDLAISGTSFNRENEPVKKTPTLDKLLLNNSFWDSMDSDDSAQEDNEIQSFYQNESATPAHITIIRDIAEDDDSSPIAKSLTPESQTSNEILSFYGSQSPESMICSLSQSILKAPEAKSTHDNGTPVSDITKQRSGGISSPVIPHSTPAGSSAKKTPSPLYTPILKKLMIKKVNEKDKRRISSQRFRTEPFLPEIEEEEDGKRKEPDKNTTLSLPLELECDRSKIESKSLLNTSKMSSCSGGSYQIDGASLENTCGFKMNLENLQDIKTDKQFQFITLFSLEVFAATRGDLKPDPEYDPVTCIFYSIHHDAPEFPDLISGIIVVSEDPLPADLNRFKCEKIVVSSEAELFDRFLVVIRKWDPDMFIGYEVEMLSWGFLIQRGYFLGRNLSQELSRVRETKQNEPTERPSYEEDEYSNELKLPGRIVLNVWRLMRHEVNLQSYTFENIIFHVMHQRIPYHNFKFLTDCWNNSFKRWIVVDYFLFRAESNISLLEQLDFICRTSELAKLFGIQFYEVLSRGSQFRVESMMLRLAKTQNYVAVSPSIKQRAQMRAPESLPLIMEPESKFYTDPVIVLDFQSLYPSIIIAYNYCFSTCLGRIDSLGQDEPFHFGCVEHTVPMELLVKLENSLNLSPAGVAFVDKTVRKGILPSMLEEILETRLMVKASLKENKDNSPLARVLHARQLGLKLIANVTYGYTSANFSGRMPCMEIADSVVSKGRETLERAIELVNGTEKWGSRVIYGDTDSLFVLVPNRAKEEAFRIGSEIAEAVTNQNPKPVKLKLEKVYTTSILQTKKRYVGYMYESPNQEKPVYDAKGIETVRRDGCPAVSKILEKSLKLLFETKNVNTVKQYVQRQFTKLITGRISIQELTFAREYRGMNSYKPAACVPALQLAKQALMKDKRAEPRIKERVRYVIVTGAPGVPLIRLVRTPQEFLDTPGSLINTEYYITRAIIPALERCFMLMNVNVRAWYTELPKKQKLNLPIDYEFRNKTFKKTTISHYFSSSKCISCSKVAGSSVCRQCEHKPQRLALILGNMINQWQRKHNNVAKICRSCCGRNEPIGCSSLDCPIYYLFRQTDQDAEQVRYAENLKQEYLYF